MPEYSILLFVTRFREGRSRESKVVGNQHHTGHLPLQGGVEGGDQCLSQPEGEDQLGARHEQLLKLVLDKA